MWTELGFIDILKTGEAGKAAGVKHARNEIIALIDPDNILPSRDWLSRMKNFEKVLSKTFKKGLSNDGYGAPYPDTPSRGVTREGDIKYPLYVIKGRNPL